MTVLLDRGDADGRWRCDERCHRATHQRCVCVCAGRYHGIGPERARTKLLRDLNRGLFRDGGLLHSIAVYMTNDAQQTGLFDNQEVTQ